MLYLKASFKILRDSFKSSTSEGEELLMYDVGKSVEGWTHRPLVEKLGSSFTFAFAVLQLFLPLDRSLAWLLSSLSNTFTVTNSVVTTIDNVNCAKRNARYSSLGHGVGNPRNTLRRSVPSSGSLHVGSSDIE